jgi:hypothetical protein
MKTASALMNSGILLNDEAACQRNGLAIKPAPSYARDLRVVGQLLERREIGSADLVYVADAYIIRGIQKTNDNSRSGVRFSRRLMTRLDAILRGDFRHSFVHTLFRLLYRCKRSSVSPMPDPHSLSHILRSAGAYLDGRKNSSLIGISLQDRWVTIRFETAEGRPEEAKQSLEYFYDYWVKMYLRRGSKAEKSADSNLQRYRLMVK